MPNQKYDSDGDIPVLDDLVLIDMPEEDLDEVAYQPEAAAQASPAAPQEPAAAQSAASVEANLAASPSFHFEIPGNKPLPRNNPFLPYEHLEQLARERIEFQKQFSQFAVAKPAPSSSAYKVAEPRPHWNPNPAGAASSGVNSQQVYFDNLTRQLTHEIISELRPQIEKRVRELLQEHLPSLGKR